MAISSTVCGVFSHNGEIELRGSPQALSLLADRLIGYDAPVVIVLKRGLREADAAPYDGWLRTIVIESSSSSALLITRCETSLHISGSREALETFGNEISCFVSILQNTPRAQIARHIHIEPMEEDPSIDKRSTPLIICEDLLE
jgi:hypothetical protein